jgi:hypothetical protein
VDETLIYLQMTMKGFDSRVDVTEDSFTRG